MGSVPVSEEIEPDFDVDETIFVAVGKRVEQSERALLWAIHYFFGKTICVLHVHKPSRSLEMRLEAEGNFEVDVLEHETTKSSQEPEQEKLRQLLDHYRRIVTERGVQAYEVWIESNDIAKGIVDIVAWQDAKWLVMGASADENYNERLADLESKKALFVCREAASSCHIWFVCKGHLIHTRGDKQASSEIEHFLPLLLTNSPTEISETEQFESESTCNRDIAEDSDGELEEIPSWLFNSNLSSDRLVYAPSASPLLLGKDQQVQKSEFKKIGVSIQQPVVDFKESKQNEFCEAMIQWKDEEDFVEAKCKAKAFQSLYVKEISFGKEIEEAVERVKHEVEKMKNEQDLLVEKLNLVIKDNLTLESHVAKSQEEIWEWEDKTVSAVKLLITFKENKDKLRKEHENAAKEVERLRRRLMKEETPSFSLLEFPVFSFSEIIEATNDFDPSWKISEGRNGTVYRGFLRQMHVAIKMLPLYGSKSRLDFQRQVGFISRVRHPNLVTLIGMCPDSESLVYEYLKEGSLEDCLRRKDNTIPWQVRICIATEICSALIFLHSNKPPIVHGNVKPSNILLDGNYVSKLGSLGIVSLVPQNSFAESEYLDPEYLDTGELRLESDIYSFGLVLLQLLTARPIQGLVTDVKCALENDSVDIILDSSAGKWDPDQATWLVQLALRCCNPNRLDRPDLASDVLAVLEPMRSLCTASSKNSVSKELKETPAHFVCPILQEIMEVPLVAADGYTYESEAIRGWLDTGHDTSPMTNLKLDHLKLVPNYVLHNAILEWQLQE